MPHMHAMVRERAVPAPGPGEVLIEIAACGVCRTDLHVVDGELPDPALPLVPGHEIVGRVAAVGTDVAGLTLGERVGVPWLGFTCGVCPYCRTERENLCDRPRFTGHHHHVAGSSYGSSHSLRVGTLMPRVLIRFCKPLADVRFAPKAAELLRRREMSSKCHRTKPLAR